MAKWVIDTNVLLAADIGEPPTHATHLSYDCRERSFEWLKAFLEQQDQVVVDAGQQILKEYRRKIRPGDFAALFLQEILRRSQVELVYIEQDETGLARLPDSLMEVVHDLADRKFVAVALAHDDRPPIVNSADTDWLDWRKDLEEHQITCYQLCSDELTEFARRKSEKKGKKR